jgi:hypothetical protein
MIKAPRFSDMRKELQGLVKCFRKGDKAAQIRLQDLLNDPRYKKVFAETYKQASKSRALLQLKAQKEKILYKMHGQPFQGGLPGLGKRK